MVILRFLLVAACSILVVACSSESPNRAVQEPGEPSVSGLQVPPDMWARPGQPTQQTASLPAR
jgi:hypothetical protein